jgi:predicted porin
LPCRCSPGTLAACRKNGRKKDRAAWLPGAQPPYASPGRIFMHKKLIALAVAGALVTSPALAQSNVTVYGVVDMGFSHRGDAYKEYDGNRSYSASSKNAIDSGLYNGSRIGFKGEEDLGNGLKALFKLENGFNGDTGTQGQGGRLFGRQAYVGLSSSSFGTVLAGRMYAPRYDFLQALDPFEDGMIGKYSNVQAMGNSHVLAGDNNDDLLVDNGLFNVARVDNAVAYVTPTWFDGLNVTAAYSTQYAGQESSNGNKGDSRVIAILPRYQNGPLDIGLSFQQIRFAKSTDSSKLALEANTNIGVNLNDDQKLTSWTLGGAYDFGKIAGDLGLKLSAFYDYSKWKDFTISSFGAQDVVTGEIGRGDLKMKNWMIGATLPYGKHSFLISYNRSKLEGIDLPGAGESLKDTTVKQWALGYVYGLSKRTKLFAAYADISQDSNKNDVSSLFGSRASLGDAVNGGDTYQNGFQLGIQHWF